MGITIVFAIGIIIHWQGHAYGVKEEGPWLSLVVQSALFTLFRPTTGVHNIAAHQCVYYSRNTWTPPSPFCWILVGFVFSRVPLFYSLFSLL